MRSLQRDHLIANNVMQQKGSFVAAMFTVNGIGCEGRDGSAQRRRSVINDCLVTVW